MITNINRNSAEIMKIFETRTARYIDGNGNVSIMKWIPPFTACRALTSTAAVATPSGTVGDWFHPSSSTQRGQKAQNTKYAANKESLHQAHLQ